MANYIMARDVTIKMSLQLNGVEKVFKEDMGPGVVFTEVLSFKDAPEKGEAGYNVFCAALIGYEDEFIKENINVLMEEVTDD